jgi:cell pole-organizing protein PopZ
MAEQNRESSMEEILSSIKRIIAEDKAIDEDRPLTRRKTPVKPALQAVPDVKPADRNEEILELTDELPEHQNSSAQGVFGDRRKNERLIDDDKLDSMRQSLSALVEKEAMERRPTAQYGGGTSLEEMTRDLMRPMIKQWLDANLPDLVEQLVAREIQRLNEK